MKSNGCNPSGYLSRLELPAGKCFLYFVIPAGIASAISNNHVGAYVSFFIHVELDGPGDPYDSGITRIPPGKDGACYVRGGGA